MMVNRRGEYGREGGVIEGKRLRRLQGVPTFQRALSKFPSDQTFLEMPCLEMIDDLVDVSYRFESAVRLLGAGVAVLATR